jgi:hypothetical protein
MTELALSSGSVALQDAFERVFGGAGMQVRRGVDPAAAGLLLAPCVSETDGWDAVAAELTRSFAQVQQYTAGMEAGARKHVIVLIPAAAAMGDPQQPRASALAGGLLSMFRTFALEFRKGGTSANALMYELANGEVAGGDALAATVGALVGQSAAHITGQEVFAWSGQDSGRLRP